MPFLTLAQSVHVGINGGFSSYLGDLQNKQFLINIKDPSLGIHVRYEWNNHFTIRAGFNSARISAYDKNNSPLLQARNLSFITNLNELSLTVEYAVFDLKKYRLTPHVFAGVAGYHFNPYAYDFAGNKVYLRPLKTEGQGLPQYKDRKAYSLFQFSLPVGGGLRYSINDDVVLGMEIGYRRLFTDYLDDVSGDYADKTILETMVGPKSVEMAFRGGEIITNGSVTYPNEGTPRGKSRFNDWYTFYHITYSMSLSSILDINNKRGRVTCPRKF